MDPFIEINAIRKGLADGEYSSAEITKFYLDRATTTTTQTNKQSKQSSKRKTLIIKLQKALLALLPEYP